MRLENKKQKPQKKLKSKKMQTNLLLQNKDRKKFYLLCYLPLAGYLNRLYAKVLNESNLKQQLQMAKKNAD